MKRPKQTDKECRRQGMMDVPVANYSKMQDKYIDYLEKKVKKLTLTSVGVSETELVCLYCKDKVKKEDIVIQCDECYGVNHP